MIEVDRLVMYRYGDEYRLAIINKDRTLVALVVNNKIVNFHKENLFTHKYWGGNEIDGYEELESSSFRDFIRRLANDDRKHVLTYPDSRLLPDPKKFQKFDQLIPHLGIALEREQLAKIEKYLNKTVFRELIEHDHRKPKNNLEYTDF
ncbi:MAG: hypothetical protein J5779_01745 [Clostridia bacterium]|nr:hypothetical protein [Clostridia bacterium]